MNPFKCISSLSAVVIASALCGCATEGVRNPSGKQVTEISAGDKGFVAGTGIESQDVIKVADQMSRSIMGLPQIMNAQGTPCIVLDPVINETRFPINKDLFLDVIRGQLIRNAQGKVMFLARERMLALEHERQLKQTGQVTSTTDPALNEFKGADYFLTGKLTGLSTHTGEGLSDYIHYSFQLIDVRTSAIVWEDFADIKKQGQVDAVYR